MKPIALFQHTHVGLPGAVNTVLKELDVPWVVVPVMDGALIPADPSCFSGLILMGGSMGVNDGLDWIDDQIRLVQRAREQGIPVAGHCLGSQVMAAAFGASVARGPQIEIGWQPLALEPVPQSVEWFGKGVDEVFQWHGDTFDVPEQAIRIATSDAYPNQAFVLDDRHIGMQFHLEMTPELVELYLRINGGIIDRELAKGATLVNSREQIEHALEQRLANMHAMLRSVYGRWAKGLQA